MTRSDNTTKTQEQTIVTTHMNADFDAIASVLAAQKLYPGAIVVLPGSNEKNLRNFFISSMAYLFNMTHIRDIDPATVKRLVMVDTSQKARIGKLAELIERPGYENLDIHIYDHHPPSEGDFTGDNRVSVRVVESTGATVSILTGILREKAIDISANEATVMCLGIYEDTGGFTFTSTTPRDFEAAGYLLSMGANLTTVANIISREMTPEQVDILNNMIKNAHSHKIKGTEVVVTTISTETYVPDFAFLVHKMQKMNNLNALFAVAQMNNKIYIVGRSRIPEVNAGQALKPFGGGGHAYAASAGIKEMTLAQTEQELLTILQQQVQTRTRARDIMSSPPITATKTDPCRKVGELLTRYNINSLLITEKPEGHGRVLGFITRQVIEKALYHELGDAPAGDYMTTNVSLATPDEELPEIQKKIIENNQRMLPVVENENGSAKGVITRTDLLNILVYQHETDKKHQAEALDGSVHPKTKSVRRFMQERLYDGMLDILKNAGEIASGLGFNAYVVGGFVRDMFLYRPTEDVDLVIEGDGIAFAQQFAALMDARVHYYKKFGTAVVTLPDESKIDVASARMEYYKFPAALPTVEMSSIKLDLFRRDFTINTLAISLHPDRFGTLIDFFSAQRDIKEKTIRVLHSLSFVEDPTRIFRAIRFAQRFEFTIGKMTSGLIENAVKMDFFKRLSGRRVFGELRQILEEDNPVPAIHLLSDYNLMAAIHPAIKVDKNVLNILDAAREVVAWYELLFLEDTCDRWMVYFLVLLKGCDQEKTEEICNRFELNRRHQHLFIKERLDADDALHWLKRDRSPENSRLFDRLSEFKIELILYIMAVAGDNDIKRRISHYIVHLKGMEPLIKGRDLKAMGISEGPVYSRILNAVRRARLDGIVKTHQDELTFARDYVSND
ncbi:MAG: CBS domain-containing protein [Thermodesulfobacteriota bacterium]|nr:CBS domain-containing protein [Thermodesulfobacteriota bacterium]